MIRGSITKEKTGKEIGGEWSASRHALRVRRCHSRGRLKDRIERSGVNALARTTSVGNRRGSGPEGKELTFRRNSF